MKSQFTGRLGVVLAVSMALAGCETMGELQNPFTDLMSFQSTSSLPVSPAEQQLLDDEKRFNNTVMSAVLTGAVAGGLSGAIIGASTGKSSKDVRDAAFVGMVVGGTAMGIDGYVTAKKEQASRERTRATEAAANDVREDNQRLQRYVESSSRVLEEGTSRLASLKRDIASKKITAEEERRAREREERNIASINKTLTEARKTRDQYMEASSKLPGTPRNKRSLDSEISQMNQQIKTLEGNVAAYNQALQVSRA
jgi:hypothetical protein